MVEQGDATAGPATSVYRLQAWAGQASMWAAQLCCLVLLSTLAWGPHWPFSLFDIVAPRAGLLNAGFDLADLLLVGMLAGWALALLTGQVRLELRPRWISGPIMVLALAAALACLTAQDHTAAFRFAVRSLALAALFFYLQSCLDRHRLTPAALAYWLAPGLALNGLLAIAQIIHQDPLGLTWLGEPAMFRSAPGTAVVLVNGKPLLRAFGVLPHANVLGGLLAAGLPLVAGLLIHSDTAGSTRLERDTRRPGGLRRDLVLLLCLVLIIAGLILSFSRSAWVGLLFGGLYLACRRATIRRRLTRRAALIGAGIGLVVAVLLAAEWGAVSVRLQPESNQLERNSVQQRLSLQELTFKVIAWRPLTGVGGNNLGRAEARFLPPGEGEGPQLLPVHNTYLLAQAELGPLGASAWLALMLVPIVSLVLNRRTRRDAAISEARAVVWPLQQRTLWQALAGGSLIVVAVTGLFDFYIWVNEPVAVLWIVALALFANTPRAPETLAQLAPAR